METGEVKPKVYTAKEVAEMLRVHQSTVTYWVRTGKVKAIRTPGGRIRIPREEVERILNGGGQ